MAKENKPDGTRTENDFDLSECLLEHNWEDIKEQYSIGLIGKEVQVLYSGHHNKPTITEYVLEGDSFKCTFRNGVEYWYDGESIRKQF